MTKRDQHLGATVAYPTNGLFPGRLFWDTTLVSLMVWNGAAWTAVGGGAGVPLPPAPPGGSLLVDDAAGTGWLPLTVNNPSDNEMVIFPAGGAAPLNLALGRNVPGTDDLVPVGAMLFAPVAPGAGWTATGPSSAPMNAWLAAHGGGSPFSVFEKI